MATETEAGDTGVTAISIGSQDLSSPNNGRVDDGVCTGGMWLFTGNVGLRIQINDPSMANNPTSVLAKVEMRLNESSGMGYTSNIKMRRVSASYCSGHTVMGSSGSTCASTTWSGWATCTHTQRPRTIAEAKGTVTIEWLKNIAGVFDTSYHDGVQVRYTYYQMGTPAAPTIEGASAGHFYVNKGASPTGATHWNVWRSNTAFGSYTRISAEYMIVSSTQFFDTTDHGNGVTRYYKLKYSAQDNGDFSIIGSYGSGTTWVVSDAPTWAGTKFTARTISTITLDWVTPGDDGGTAITEYWYDWKIDGGGYATIDTNSTNTIATKPSLVAGTKYWFKILARNAVGSSPFTSEEFHWTLCATPSAPTVTANAVGSLRIQHSDITGIDKWRVMRSATSGGSYSQVYLSGAGAGALDWSDTGEGNGVTWYYKLYARNVDGNDSGLSAYASGTTWDYANAPTWASPKFPNEATSNIQLDWVAPGDDGGSTITEYWYDWKTDGGSYATIDTNSTSTIATKYTLPHGTKYWFKVLARNAVGSSPFTSEEFHWTLCLTPNAPTVTANAVGSLRIQHFNYAGVANWRVMRSATSGGSYSEVYLGGGGGALDWSDEDEGNGTTWYYKLYARNADGNYSVLSVYASGTTWDLPDAQDPVSATVPYDSMILITRNGSYPDGNGEPVDSWEVWRSSTSGGSYSLIQDGITATTYEDWSVNGGETWYYKLKFTNLVGDSVLSTNYVNNTVTTAEITKESYTRIKVLDKKINEFIGNILRNPDFEAGSSIPPYQWTGDATSTSTAYYVRNGTYGCKLAEGNGPYSEAYMEQTLPNFSTDYITELSFWVRITDSNVRVRLYYTDVTFDTFYYNGGTGDWQQKTITPFPPGKFIDKLRLETTTSGTNTVAVDDILFLVDSPSIRSDTTIQLITDKVFDSFTTIQLITDNQYDSFTTIFRSGFDTKDLESFTAIQLITDNQYDSFTAIQLITDNQYDSFTAIQLTTDNQYDSFTAIQLITDNQYDSFTAIQLITDKVLESFTTIQLTTDNTFASFTAIQLTADKVLESFIAIQLTTDNTFASFTAIQLTTDKDLASFTAIGSSTGIQLIAKTAIKRIQYGDIELDSWTTVVWITDNQFESFSRILKTEIDDKQFDSFTTIEQTTDKSFNSNTRVKRVVGGIIGKLARTYIINRVEIDKTSSTVVYRAAFDDIQLTSGTSIVQFQAFDKPSDIRLLKSTDSTLASDTFIIYQFDVTKVSDTYIININDLARASDTVILKTVDISALSDSRVVKSAEMTQLSSTRIKSGAFIQIWYRCDILILSRVTNDVGSTTAIKRYGFDTIDMASNIEIVRVTDIQLSSNVAIQHQFETSEQSQTRIEVRTDILKVSETYIKQINKLSVLSSTRILTIVTDDLALLSSTRIRIDEKDVVDITGSSAISVTSKVQYTSTTLIRGRIGEFPS